MFTGELTATQTNASFNALATHNTHIALVINIYDILTFRAEHESLFSRRNK